MFAELIDQIIEDYKKNPTNRILIDEKTLLAAANEETGNNITSDQLRVSIKNYLLGEMDGDDYMIYDGAIYACSVASNNCFGDPEENEDDDDYSVDYQINWIENADGSYSAEVSQS